LKAKDGEFITAGDELTEGSVNPHDLLKVKGVRGVQLYLLQEVQRVYRLQGVDINDKHIEVIIRQVLKRVKVEDAGDTYLLPGGLVDSFVFEEVNNKAREEGLREATARPVLLGITKASLATDSFLSAASFQETTRVLTEAAIKAKDDPLMGLKGERHHRQADPRRYRHEPLPQHQHQYSPVRSGGAADECRG
jgi:DNA-directed RNA polymerase subunit beta'